MRLKAPHTAPTFESVRAALDFIPPDVGHDERVRLAFAVFDGIGDAGAELWHEWPAGEQAKRAEDRATWRSARKRGPVKVGTLFGLAKDHGYKLEATAAPPHKPDADELKARAEARRAAAAREQAERDRAPARAAAEAARLWDRRERRRRSGVPCA